MKHILTSALILLSVLAALSLTAKDDLTVPWPSGSGEEKGNTMRIVSPLGDLVAQGPIRQGMKHGNWEVFIPAKKGKHVIAQGAFYQDKKYGNWEVFNKKGIKIRKLTYSKGKLVQVMIYYSSGIPEKIYTMLDGVKHGKFQHYYPDGKPMEICWYENDKRDGQSNLYYSTGKPRAIGKYSGGKKVGTWRFFNERGRLHIKGHFSQDRKTGTWTWYDERGAVTETKEF